MKEMRKEDLDDLNEDKKELNEDKKDLKVDKKGKSKTMKDMRK